MPAASLRRADQLPPGGIWLLAALTLTWGANWPAMKLSLAEVEPWTFRTACLLVGAFGLFGIALSFGQRLRIPREDLKPVILLALLNVSVWHIVTAFGITLIEAGRASMIAYTMPLWATILSVTFLRERLSPIQVVGLAAGIAGIALLLLPAATGISQSLTGALLMFTAAITWAIGVIGMKRVQWRMPVVQLTAWQLAIGGLPILAGMIIAGRPSSLLQISWAGGISLFYACVVGMIFCHYAWFKIVQLFPASIASISMLGVPVVGLLSSAFILGEPIGMTDVAALLLIVTALALVLVAPGLARGFRRRPG